MLKKKRIILMAILGLCAAVFLIFLTRRIINSFKEIQKDLDRDLPSTYTITSEDSNLIAKKYIKDLKANIIVRNKVRGPVSLIYFDKEYHLIIYKLALIKGGGLEDLLHTVNESVDRTSGETYTVINYNDFFKFQLNIAPSKSVSQIYLTLAGDSLQNVVKNDSIVSYHLLCENLSIKYAKNDPIGIFLVGQDKMLGATTIVPMDLLFLKRDDAVFLLIMTPNSSKLTIAPDLLYNIVTGE
jgi:hypothetical protein